MNHQLIKCFTDLVTTPEERRSGFLEYALRRNKESIPFIDRGKALKITLQQQTKDCREILKLDKIRDSLLEASGVSVKAKFHLTDDDKTQMLEEFVEKVLIPCGNGYIDEIVYRYLLTAGDALGGKMRNIVGAIAGEKLTRYVISHLQIQHIDFEYSFKDGIFYSSKTYNLEDAEKIKAIRWSYLNENRSIIYNINVPQVSKNIDIVLINKKIDYVKGAQLKTLLNDSSIYLAFGELKGGIDPAGADEHWKTASSALERVRNKFSGNANLFFIGAAIERAMAEEIYKQCLDNKLANCANLTKDDQLASLCEWITSI